MSDRHTGGAAIIGISHVAIAVPDADRAAETLERIFGLTAEPALNNSAQGVRLRRVRIGPVHIELLQPLRPDGPIGKFVSRHSAGGLHHLSFNTRGLEGVIAHARQGGADMLGSIGRNVDGDRFTFLSPASVCGVLVELEEREEPKPVPDAGPHT